MRAVDRLYVPLLILVSACIVDRVLAGDCPGGISAEMAQRVFDQVKSVPVGDGYRFDGVETKGTLVVRWSLHGRSCPPIQIEPGACESSTSSRPLQLRVPVGLSADCPELQKVVDAIAATLADGPPDQTQPSPPVSTVSFLLIALVLALAVGTLVARLVPPGPRRVLLQCGVIIVTAEIAYRALLWSFQADGGARDDVFMLYGLGESTMAGEPFDERLSLAGLVSEMLGRHIRDRPIEVRNLAARRAGAYTQSLYFEQEIAHRNRAGAGAVLIYAGHNEPYLAPSDATVAANDERSSLAASTADAWHLPEHFWLLRDALVYMRSLRPFRPHVGMDSYEQSLRRIIEAAQGTGLVPVLFTLPSNISGVEPNAYAADTPGITAILETGTALEREDLDAAVKYYREQQRALGSESAPAALLVLYRIAHCEAAPGRYADARRDFWTVVNRDPRLNFGRTTQAQNALIRRRAAEFGVPLVDRSRPSKRRLRTAFWVTTSFPTGTIPRCAAIGFWRPLAPTVSP